jgi:hypothetical protein
VEEARLTPCRGGVDFPWAPPTPQWVEWQAPSRRLRTTAMLGSSRVGLRKNFTRCRLSRRPCTSTAPHSSSTLAGPTPTRSLTLMPRHNNNSIPHCLDRRIDTATLCPHLPPPLLILRRFASRLSVQHSALSNTVGDSLLWPQQFFRSPVHQRSGSRTIRIVCHQKCLPMAQQLHHRQQFEAGRRQDTALLAAREPRRPRHPLTRITRHLRTAMAGWLQWNRSCLRPCRKGATS